MDTTRVRELSDRLISFSISYDTTLTEKTAINGQTSGTMTVNGATISVTGTDFDDLIAAKVVVLDADLVTTTANMQTTLDTLDTLI